MRSVRLMLAFAIPMLALGDQLQQVVILSRHGVRSPLSSNASMAVYAAKPWPDWPVPPGYLTPHGKELMRILGGYYRDYYAHAGLLHAGRCDGDEVYVWADTDERTLRTAEGLVAGIAPGCRVTIHSKPIGESDLLFHPKVSSDQAKQAACEVQNRITKEWGSLDGLRQHYVKPLTQLQGILNCCAPSLCQPAGPPCTLLNLPQSITPGKGDSAVKIEGTFSVGSTTAETLDLEMAQGMLGAGWGNATPDNVSESMKIYTASYEYNERTPYVGQVQASKLGLKILEMLEQAGGKNKLSFLVGHDTNVSSVAGLLQLSWNPTPSFQPNDTPPGGALAFELWERAGSKKRYVRAAFISLTLPQMGIESPLSPENPPVHAKVSIAGCGGNDCPFERFRQIVHEAVARKFSPCE